MNDGEGQEVVQPQGQKPEQKKEEPIVDLGQKFPKQTQEFSKGNVVFRDIAPENLREGGDVPIVLMAGWGMRQDVVGNTSQGLYDLGQKVIPLDIDGGAKGITGRFQSELDRQGDVVYEWLKSNPDQKFRFAPQSLSALTILSMVERHPDVVDQIDGIVELSPMGHAGDASEHTLEVSEPSYFAEKKEKKGFKARVLDTAMKVGGEKMYNLLQRKFAEDTRNNNREKTDEDRQIEARVMESIGKALDPRERANIIKSAREAFEMAGADKYNTLNLLKAKGIKVGIIQGAQDRLNSARGLAENISRQAVANSSVSEEFRDEKGVEKIPEELKILPTDSPEVVQEKQRKIVALKLELQKAENKVPIDSLVFVEGGHEITGPYGFAKDIIKAFDFIDHPERFRNALNENLKRNADAEKLKQAEAQELAEVRGQLTEEATQPPQNPVQ